MLNARERQRVDVMKIKCLKNICGLKRIDRVRNILIRGGGVEIKSRLLESKSESPLGK